MHGGASLPSVMVRLQQVSNPRLYITQRPVSPGTGLRLRGWEGLLRLPTWASPVHQPPG